MHSSTTILHHWLAFMATTQGRDKLYRTVQYFARFLAFYLAKAGRVDASKRMLVLSSTVGMSRKLFRMGKPLDHLQAMMRAMDHRDGLTKWLGASKATGLGCWLLLDSLQWVLRTLHGTGVYRLHPASMAVVNQIAPRLWALGLASSAALNATHLLAWYPESGLRAKAGGSAVQHVRAVAEDARGRQLGLDLLQDLLDLVIPLSSIGVLDVGPGSVGLVGTVTSVMGAYAVLRKQLAK